MIFLQFNGSYKTIDITVRLKHTTSEYRDINGFSMRILIWKRNERRISMVFQWGFIHNLHKVDVTMIIREDSRSGVSRCQSFGQQCRLVIENGVTPLTSDT